MVVYVDVLLILNLFVDYFLLLGCCVILKTNVEKKRIVLGAVVGSLFSLSIFLVEFNAFLFMLIKIFSALVLVLLTFGFKTKQLILKSFLVFLIENFVFAGVMFCVWVLFSPPGMLWKNGITYIAISPIVLIFGSLLAYFLTCAFNLIFARRVDSKKIYGLKIQVDNKNVELSALYDTGNCLIEPFSKKPVCVCEFECVKSLLPETVVKFFSNCSAFSFDKIDLKKFCQIKLVPCNTISGESILPAFLPQSVVVKFNGKQINYDCYIGVVNRKLSDGEYCAIIGDFK